MARHMSSESRKPEVPSSEPVMIWILFISTKPIGGVGEAGVGVEQRDDHRHVGRADRHDEQEAEQQRQTRP